jgi:hypothetical protein
MSHSIKDQITQQIKDGTFGLKLEDIAQLTARGEFAMVPALKSGRGIESHRITASVQTVNGTQYVMVNRSSHDYEQAVQLRDWLNAALKTSEEATHE